MSFCLVRWVPQTAFTYIPSSIPPPSPAEPSIKYLVPKHAVRDFKAQSRKVSRETASQTTDQLQPSTPNCLPAGRCRLQPRQT